MNHVDQRNYVVDGRVRQDAVAEVEDMAAMTANTFQDAPRTPPQLVARREQRHRVEVALDADVVANSFPGDVQVDAPVDTNYVPARSAHQLQQAGSARAEVNHRNTRRDGVDHLTHMRQHEAFVVLGR